MKENDAVWDGEKDRRCPGSGEISHHGLFSSDERAYRECPACGVQLPVKAGGRMWTHNVPRILAKRPKAKP